MGQVLVRAGVIVCACLSKLGLDSQRDENGTTTDTGPGTSVVSSMATSLRWGHSDVLYDLPK